MFGTFIIVGTIAFILFVGVLHFGIRFINYLANTVSAFFRHAREASNKRAAIREQKRIARRDSALASLNARIAPESKSKVFPTINVKIDYAEYDTPTFASLKRMNELLILRTQRALERELDQSKQDNSKYASLSSDGSNHLDDFAGLDLVSTT